MFSGLVVAFLVISVVSLLFYKAQEAALKLGFMALSLVCLAGVWCFAGDLKGVHEFALKGFLFESKFSTNLFGNIFCLIICLIGLAGSVYSLDYVKHVKGNKAVFVSMTSGFLLSMLLVVASGDVFTFMVMWEVMTLLSALLLKFNDEHGSNKTVMIYLGIAQAGAFCITIALLIMGSSIGSFVFADWSAMNLNSYYSSVCLVLLLVGFGSKAGMFPFHVWLPLAYPLAPANISAFMSGVMLKVAIFAFVKFAFLLKIPTWFALVVIVLGAFSAIWGIAHALFQKEYKVLLAYSSVENVGIIFLGVGAALYGASVSNPALFVLGVVGALFHSFNHALFKSLLFFGSGAVHYATGEKEFSEVGGLAKKMPLTSLCFLVGSMAICALPPLNGFFGEWFIYKALFQAGLTDGFWARLVSTLSIVALAVAGAVAVFAFVRLYGFLFCGALKNENAHERFPSMICAMGFLALLCVVVGLYGNSFAEMFKQTALIIKPNLILQNVGSLNFVALFVMLALLLVLPFSWFFALGSNGTRPRMTAPWAAGFKHDPRRMGSNSSSFVGDAKRILGFLVGFKSEFKQESYFAVSGYESKTDDFWWAKFYAPVVRLNAFLGEKIGCMQNGKSAFYVGYIVVYLVAMLAVGSYFLGA